MSGSSSKDIKAVALRMRDEWDRRIRHDYRYWMSDGIVDDSAMFEVGERDFGILTKGMDLGQASQQTVLELGCGVGRILKAAAGVYGRAIGVDVSEAAVKEARRLLGDVSNVEVLVGNGLDLSGVADSSIDFAYSFAALSSMPVLVIASYLAELNRVCTADAVVRLQVYLGEYQPTCAEDTLAIRSFERGRFVAAVAESGFSLDDLEELVLPFEISDRENGQIASIASLRKSGQPHLTLEEVAAVLLPEGEGEAGGEWKGSQTEYLMAVARASQLMDAGDAEGALTALDFAVSCYAEPEAEVVSMRDELAATLKSLPGPQSPSVKLNKPPESGVVGDPKGRLQGFFRADHLERNLAVLSKRFPELGEKLSGAGLNEHISVVSGASGLPVLLFKGTPLDNIDKPGRSAEVWIEQALSSERLRGAGAITLLGFAGGYQLQAALQKSAAPIVVYEPRLEILKAALAVRDLSDELSRVESICVQAGDLASVFDASDDTGGMELLIHPQTQAISRSLIDEVKQSFWASRGLAELKPSIGIVGPIYGGTLPIARYVERALAGMGQRAHAFHLGGFYEAYKELGRYLKQKERRDVVESQYVELLSQLVLEGIKEQPVDILICMAQAPLSPRALTELREQGVITAMWFVEDCRRFLTWKEISCFFDYMFVIQKEPYLELVEAAGAGRAIYLPTGCDPIEHRPLDLPQEERQRWGSEISFVGAGYNNRQQMFASLVDRDFKIWGTEWPSAAPFDRLVQEQGRRLETSEYVKIFNSSAINLNLHSSSERDGVDPSGDFLNPRTFELASAGAFQLVDSRVLLPEAFEEGEEVAVFSDRRELNEMLDYYLAHPEERSRIAEAGRARALADHTYSHRLRDLLGHIYADHYAELKNRMQSGPWPRVYEAVEDCPELRVRYDKVRQRGGDPDLNNLVFDIQIGQGTLDDTDLKLLFLHHVKTQIATITDKRDGKSQ